MKRTTKIIIGALSVVCVAVIAIGAIEAPAAAPAAVAVVDRDIPKVPGAHAGPRAGAGVVPAVAPAALAADERALFEQAQAVLFTNPRATLEILRAGDSQFPRGAYADQRQMLKLRAKVNLDQIPEARVDATEYLELNPRSPIAPDIHQLLGIHPPPEMGPPR